MAHLSYVNVFTHNLDALPDFYKAVFGLREIEEIRSPIFRGIAAGAVNIGFNAQEAYGLLNLAEHDEVSGVKFLLNFDVATSGDVDSLTPAAVAAGATLIKAPYRTYYDWYQAVLLDPEGNAFRINTVL